MRGSPQRELTFFTESFIDELAHAAGIEPLAFRMSSWEKTGGSHAALQGAARLAQWDGGGPGSTMGIAGCSAFGSHIGLVAMASIGADQRIKVHRLVAAVDCGRLVNSGLVTQQIEGALIWALAQAAGPAPGWIAGMPRARALSSVGLTRMGDAPEIIVNRSRAATRLAESAALEPQRSRRPLQTQSMRGRARGCEACRSILSLPSEPPARPSPRSEPPDRRAADRLRNPDAPEVRAVRRYLAEFLSDLSHRDTGDCLEADLARLHSEDTASPFRRGL